MSGSLAGLDNPRRLRRLRVSVPLIGTLLLFGPNPLARRVTPLPDDARVAFVHLDPERDELVCFIQSETFDIVPEGALIPVLEVMYESRQSDPA